jgi:hypothetical protein
MERVDQRRAYACMVSGFQLWAYDDVDGASRTTVRQALVAARSDGLVLSFLEARRRLAALSNVASSTVDTEHAQRIRWQLTLESCGATTELVQSLNSVSSILGIKSPAKKKKILGIKRMITLANTSELQSDRHEIQTKMSSTSVTSSCCYYFYVVNQSVTMAARTETTAVTTGALPRPR